MRKIFIYLVLTILCLTIQAPFCIADTIPVQAQQTAPRTVTLNWAAGSGSVDVYRQYPGESQPSLIGNTSQNSWIDHHGRGVCDDTVHYRIEGEGIIGFAAVPVSDNEPTAPAEWGVVTVDQSTQRIVLRWNASRDTDIMGYIILEGTPSITIDTVFGRENTTYTYTLSDSISVHQFRIFAFDSCRRASEITNPCNNVVAILETEPCGRNVVVSWNKYNNMPSGIAAYEIWASQNGEAYSLMGRQTNIESTSLSFNVRENCQTLSVYVKVISVNGVDTAFSNRRDYNFSTSQRPAYLYLRRVTVSDDQSIVEVVGQTEPGWDGLDYVVYRSVGEGAAAVRGHCTPDAQGLIHWNDNSVNVGNEVYTYFLGVTDGCGLNEMRSQSASTILPVVESNAAGISLAWNAYEGWEGATSYYVYSSGADNGFWRFEGATTDTRIADIGDIAEGQRRYKVVAYEGANSLYHLSDSVQSAIAYFRPATELWMPNAFTPCENSNNRIGPKSTYINPEGYSFVIYNRMGLLVFQTNDPAAVWDGTYKGIAQPQGTYIYKITYLQSDGTEQQKIGTITLIK